MKFYRSRIDHDGKVFSGLFFYHIPKTGGISLFTALRFALLSAGSNDAGQPSPRVFRFDDQDAAPDPALDYRLVASHRAYGAHRSFGQPFDLVTLVRDPIERLRSSYTYQCLRTGRPPAPADFEAMLRCEQHANCMVKQLAGCSGMTAPAGPEHLDRALATLASDFMCYADVDRLSTVLEYFLSSRRLPNVAMPFLNRSVDTVPFEAAPYHDDIAERNRLDLALVDRVRRAPRLPVQPVRSPALHPVTVVITEAGNTTRSEGKARSVLTETVRDIFT